MGRPEHRELVYVNPYVHRNGNGDGEPCSICHDATVKVETANRARNVWEVA